MVLKFGLNVEALPLLLIRTAGAPISDTVSRRLEASIGLREAESLRAGNNGSQH